MDRTDPSLDASDFSAASQGYGKQTDAKRSQNIRFLRTLAFIHTVGFRHCMKTGILSISPVLKPGDS